MKILEVKNISKTFGLGRTLIKAVVNISFSLNGGEKILIMGPSGSGKTTLLSIIGGLMKPTSGEVFIDGQDITKLSEKQLPAIRLKKIGFVFQTFNLLSNFTALENVLLSLQEAGMDSKKAKERARELLIKLGLKERLDHLPKNLSGGEKQRVAMARALANNPKIILADEPTGNLDSKTGQEVISLLCKVVCEEGKGVIIASHDSRIKEIADKIYYMEDGKFIKVVEKTKHKD